MLDICPSIAHNLTLRSSVSMGCAVIVVSCNETNGAKNRLA